MHDEAIALLASLSGPEGIHASRAETANYRAVFTRDAVMAGIAGLLADQPVVIAAFVRTLERLRSLQGAQGQVPSNFAVAGSGFATSFGTLAPRIDAASWYLIGIAAAARAGTLDAERFRPSAAAVVNLLEGIEYNGRHLLHVPAGSNWADEFILDGCVLHDQVIRSWALRLLGATYAEARWSEKAQRIEEAIGARYWPAGAAEPARPAASVSATGNRDMFDLSACALLVCAGLVKGRHAALLDWIASHYLAAGALPPAFAPVIREGDRDWDALRRYHLHGFRNRPHEYHNGGVWPIWIGWLALAFGRAGRFEDVARLRRLFEAQVASAGGWRFEEFLHGVTGRPGGMPDMAYSATGVIFLHLASTGRAGHIPE